MTDLRTLGSRDRAEVMEFLDRSPAENLFLTSKIDEYGIDRRRLGRLLAYPKQGDITAICLDGGTLFATGNDAAALPRFVEALSEFRRCTSIVGPTFACLGLYVGLAERYGRSWGQVSNIRRRQPLMLLDGPVQGEPDERVQLLDESCFNTYLDASVDMYTDEIGSSPFKYGPGYESYVLARLKQGDAYGIIEDGEVIFKADIGPSHAGQAQLQGVWVKPELRGQGIAVPALSAMLRQVRREHPQISLYVNDFNEPAIRTYERLGFRTVGSLSTVHY